MTEQMTERGFAKAEGKPRPPSAMKADALPSVHVDVDALEAATSPAVGSSSPAPPAPPSGQVSAPGSSAGPSAGPSEEIRAKMKEKSRAVAFDGAPSNKIMM